VRARWPATVVLAATAGLAEAGNSFRCDGQIVEEGERQIEVQRACGQPDFRDAWDEYLLYTPYPAAHVEEWYYNFGPSRLVQLLKFRNGRLSQIESAGYGYARVPGSGCDPKDIDFGISHFELIARCGYPSSQERRIELRSQRLSGDRYSYPVGTRVDEWVYNFGPGHFLRHVTLVDGRVDKVEIGDRGWR
jgi:hypothetical protein